MDNNNGDAGGGFANRCAGGDVAGGAGKTDCLESHADVSEAVECSSAMDVHKGLALERALQELERQTARAEYADEERRRFLESTRHNKGTIRILGRVRPALDGEEEDGGCLRMLSKSQLEVLTEPRALLTEQALRNRRKTTGGIRDSQGSKSSSMLAEVPGRPQVPAEKEIPEACMEPKTYAFDRVFDSVASDDEIFTSVHDEIAAAVNGEAVCILAYGATGSGKTHTVVNLAQRASQELERQAIALARGCVLLEITVQIVEIYNEQLRDLLAGDGNAEPPRLKLSASNSTTTLQGATTRAISTESGKGIAPYLEDAFRLGQAQRATSATAVHSRSSRSHLVMMLLLAVRDKVTGVLQRTGKLSLVDLAGSERIKKSEAVGERLREAQHINRSLSALADVILAKEQKSSYVPYRNSKLTHLLQDALGGQQQCRTVVIIALPPTRTCLNDTIHSLQFSTRLTALSLPSAGRNGQQGRGNRLSSMPGGGQMRVENERLKTENETLRAQLAHQEARLAQTKEQLDEERKRRQQLQETTEAGSGLKASEQILLQFAAVHRRLQEVEATALPPSLGVLSPHSSQDMLSTEVPRRGPANAGSRNRQAPRCGMQQRKIEDKSCSIQIQPVLRTSRSAGVGEGASRPSQQRSTQSEDRTPMGSPSSAMPSTLAEPLGRVRSEGAARRRLAGGTPSTCSTPPVQLPLDFQPDGSPDLRLDIPTPARAQAARESSRSKVPPVALPRGVFSSHQTVSMSSPLQTSRRHAESHSPSRCRVAFNSVPQPSPSSPTTSDSSSFSESETTPSATPASGQAIPLPSPLAMVDRPISEGHSCESPRHMEGPSQESSRFISPLAKRPPAGWLSPPEPRDATTPPAAVPIFAMSPRAEHSWPCSSQSQPPAGPNGTPRTATEGSPSAVKAQRIRSVSSNRRGGTPREYTVEVISPSRARELAKDVELDAPAEAHGHSPQSPALLLCPQEAVEEGSGDEADSTGVPPRSDSSVSLSSDEGEIRDRLKQSLQLRNLNLTGNVESGDDSHARNCVPATARTSAEVHMSSQAARAGMGPTSRTAPSTRRGSPAAGRRYTASPPRSFSPPHRVGGATGSGTSLAAAAAASTGPRRAASQATTGMRSAVPSRMASASSSPQPHPNRAGGVYRGGGARRARGPLAPRGSPNTPQRQYAPVLSRRSLGTGAVAAADWRPSRR